MSDRKMTTVFENVSAEGFLWKRGKKVKSWLERWFVLDGRGFLQYYKGKGGKLLGSIDLSSTSCVNRTTLATWEECGITPPQFLKTNKHLQCLEVVTSARTYYLCSTNPESIWFEELASSRFQARRRSKIVNEATDAGQSQDVTDNATHFGWIQKMGKKVRSWKRRFFFLSAYGELLYAQDQNSVNSPLGRIHVREIDEIRPADEETWAVSAPKGADLSCCFQILTARRTFYLCCDSPAEMREWTEQLEGACLFYSLAIDSVGAQLPRSGSFVSTTTSILSRSGSTASELHLRSPRGLAAQTTRQAPTDNGEGSRVDVDVDVDNDNDDDDGEEIPEDDDLSEDLQQELESELAQLDDEVKQNKRLFHQQRKNLLTAASLRSLEATAVQASKRPRRVIILYNPVSGSGKGKMIVERQVAPVLRMAKIEYDIIPTEYAGHATDFVRLLDLSSLDGLAVCGGDGLVSEVMTGLLNRHDSRSASFPICIIPGGTANAMAHVLDGNPNASDATLIGRAALALAKGNVRAVDVVSVRVKRRKNQQQAFAKATTSAPQPSPAHKEQQVDVSEQFGTPEKPTLPVDLAIKEESEQQAHVPPRAEEDPDNHGVGTLLACPFAVPCANNSDHLDSAETPTALRLLQPTDEITCDAESSCTTQEKPSGCVSPKQQESSQGPIVTGACVHDEDDDDDDYVIVKSVKLCESSVPIAVAPTTNDQGKEKAASPDSGHDDADSEDASHDVEQLYGLSCIGWGLAGVCTARAQKLRWIPGQKKIRYDVAGFLTLLKDWPVVCDCLFEWKDAATGTWKKEQIGMINMIASNMDRLGVAHAICRDIKPDDGNMCVAVIDDTNSRKGTLAAALTLKKGKYLSDHKNVRSFITPEFKITPIAGTRSESIPYNLDGDPIDAGSLHVKVLHRAMNVYAMA